MDNADEKHVASSRTTITTNELPDRTMHGSLHESYEMMEHLLGGMQALNDDTQRLSSESHVYQDALQSFTEDISKVKLAVQETNSLMDAQKSNQQILEQSIASLQQQIEELRNTSYDGTLTWKISDIQQKIGRLHSNLLVEFLFIFEFLADAQSERQTSIYSPAFYSSPNGYKMRARLYLAGDGNARRTHMSIFFVLMRGDYDALLVFPFSFKVTFCLFDQSGNQRHLIDSFRPDIKSNSFQKPRSDMNIASGIPKFCPLTMIQQDSNPYVRDDTMLIKVVVDFGNLPKTVLPYTLGLNPGLPTPIQHDMIKSEIQKRAQADVPSTSSTSG
jgi:TNF receptor-associated factor 2/TNF receptor-associated factor 3